MPKRIAFYLLLLVLVPFSVSAAGLGKIKVKSGLGEPFDAEIEVLENSGDEALPLKASVGSAEEYTASGLQDAYVPQGIRIQIIRHADNTRVLHLSSDRPVNEPFLELLVKAESSNTNILRQYTILLDPPVSRFSDEPEKAKPVNTAKQAARVSQGSTGIEQPEEAIPEFIPRKSRKSSKQKPKNQAVAYDAEASTQQPASADITADTYTTQSGDVFGKVAQRYQPEGVSLKKVMAAFFAANPDAFVDGDINQLKAAQTLRIPTQESMTGSSNPAKQAEGRKPEKTQANAATQPAKDASPKFQLKISPGDTDPSTGDKPASEAAIQADAHHASANSQGTAQQSTTQQSANQEIPGAAPQAPINNVPADQVPPADAGETNPVTTVQPETPAAAATPAAVTQVDKPISAKVSAEDKSMVDSMLANLPWIAFGMAIPLLCFLVMYVMNKRRLAEVHNLQEFSDKDDEDFDAAEDLGADDSGLGETLAYEPASSQAPARVANVSQLFSAPQVKHDADMDIHEVDPLVEAEIYMSYGRDEQAESILNNALAKTPHKHELSLGLLKIYADRSDTQAFERVARTVYEAAEVGALEDVVLWGKAAILGLKIDPENTLYQIEGVTSDSKARESQPVSDIPTAQTMLEAYPVEELLVEEDIDPVAETIDFPELPPLEVGEIPSAAPLPLPDLELPEDLEALKIEQDVAVAQSTDKQSMDKSNVLEFTLDDFMRPPLDDSPEQGNASGSEPAKDEELFPAKKNTPRKK